MIVRHPLARLLSAYVDKFESGNEYFMAKYGETILAEYRRRAIIKFGRESLELRKHRKSINILWLHDND